ncbi:hypothetical protein ISTM_308 [Insectomime virus]|nr:hypothetical protein ISTM_308 [Insectomime virus]
MDTLQLVAFRGETCWTVRVYLGRSRMENTLVFLTCDRAKDVYCAVSEMIDNLFEAHEGVEFGCLADISNLFENECKRLLREQMYQTLDTLFVKATALAKTPGARKSSVNSLYDEMSYVQLGCAESFGKIKTRTEQQIC